MCAQSSASGSAPQGAAREIICVISSSTFEMRTLLAHDVSSVPQPIHSRAHCVAHCVAHGGALTMRSHCNGSVREVHRRRTDRAGVGYSRLFTISSQGRGKACGKESVYGVSACCTTYAPRGVWICMGCLGVPREVVHAARLRARCCMAPTMGRRPDERCGVRVSARAYSCTTVKYSCTTLVLVTNEQRPPQL